MKSLAVLLSKECLNAFESSLMGIDNVLARSVVIGTRRVTFLEETESRVLVQALEKKFPKLKVSRKRYRDTTAIDCISEYLNFQEIGASTPLLYHQETNFGVIPVSCEQCPFLQPNR